ncbi:MAG: cobalamin-binding protein [Treponemataceae bacterium]|nr:cobalamin-binding protein [Treponemataceae bacterium]
MKTLRIKRITALILILAVVFSALSAESYYFPQRTRNIPSRVLSLGPAGTEILFAVGAGNQVIARTDFCNYPEEALSLPSVGGFSTISLEAVIAADPELVICFAGMHDNLVEPLKAAGIGVFVSDADSIEATLSDIAQIGAITGHAAEADALVASMKKDMAAVKKTFAKKLFRKAPVKPTVYWEIWNDPFMTVGSTSFINGMLEAAGFVNVYGDLAEGYPMISEESLFARDPDVIIIPSTNWTSVESVMARPQWAELSAVKNGRVYIVDGDTSSRCGPRIVDSIKELNALAFPQ